MQAHAAMPVIKITTIDKASNSSSNNSGNQAVIKLTINRRGRDSNNKPNSTKLNREPFSSKIKRNQPNRCSACNNKWQRCRCKAQRVQPAQPAQPAQVLEGEISRMPSSTTRCIEAGARRCIRVLDRDRLLLLIKAHQQTTI